MYLPDFLNVESAVRFAHDTVLNGWSSMKPGLRPDPVELLDPETLVRRFGYAVHWMPEILSGGFNQIAEVVGIFDPLNRKIVVSEKYGLEVARFTIAHELGHILLHKGTVNHREVNPIGVRTFQRSATERDADSFAAKFLMPKKLIRAKIKGTFHQDPPITLNDHNAFFLAGDEYDYLLESDAKDLRRELALSNSVWNFQGQYITPLHTQFKVSGKAMAIRLQELAIVDL